MADESTRRDTGPGRDVGAEYGAAREPGVAIYSPAYTQPMGPATRPGLLRRISWGAIFAGAVVAVAIQLVLITLGVAIGMSTVNPTTEADPTSGLAVGAGIWWVVSGLISLFIGGWVAGRLAAFPRWIDAMLQGLVVWGLTAVASLWLLTTGLGTVLGGSMNVLSNAASNPEIARQASQGGGLTDQAQNAMQQIQREAQQLVGGGQGGGQRGTGDQQVDRTIADLLSRQPVSQADRDTAVSLLVDRGRMDRDQAEQTVRRWEREYQQASRGGGQDIYATPERGGQGGQQSEQQTRQAAERVASTVATGALWSFFALLLGAIAAAWGGALGRPAVSGASDERVHTTHRR